MSGVIASFTFDNNSEIDFTKMGLTDFQVIFEHQNKTYFSGETIIGQVNINLNREKKFRELKIELEGYGNVRWEETETRSTTDSNGNSTTESYTVTYSSSETYVKEKKVLHYGPSLPSGIHSYPFSFTLPGNLPSSFEGAHGQVRYQVKATFVRDWKWNHRAKSYFMVSGVLDLNMHPTAHLEGHDTKDKKLCCLWCKSGPITAVISSNRTGYVPGEFIGFNAEVENLSNRRMKSSSLKLYEIVTFKATQKNKTTCRTVAKLKRGEIQPGASDFWENVNMRIPSIPPTSLAGNCTIMNVRYTLEFAVEPSGPAFDLKVSIPIVIGTIPLREYMDTFLPPITASSKPLFEDLPPDYNDINSTPSAPQIDQFKMYPDLAPPSYHESVWGMTTVKSEDDLHTHGDWDFVPRYPTYSTKY